MGMEIKEFGMTPDGRKITLYTISNQNGMSASVMDYGAILTSLIVPDKNGDPADVVLGYDSPEGYFTNPGFFGATIGPNANRIGKASFVLDGNVYELDKNDGENNLHSHRQLGYHKRIWDVRTEGNSVTFSLKDVDGSLGFPGNREFCVTYTLDDENRLTLHYHGTSDRHTIINFTNHTYFNLCGQGSGSIEDHVLCLKASRYTPADAGSIPTGEIAPVAGTPMDFTSPHRIGDRIDQAFEQLKFGSGYDHNWVIDGWNGEVRQFAELTAPGTDRVLRAYTDLPGVQFYAGNFIDPQQGKEGAVYGRRGGMCLETQFFPDSANKPEFPSAVFGPEREYDSTTIYEFSCRP
ncbi:MAG: galactose mutarotase [Lachnospiraceae bacterium]|nr:galactose mutarotase [Lachnospiraceae bacterium]